MRKAIFTFLTFGMSVFLLVGGQVNAAEPEHADVRVLIDISGSMKQNDPNNLRRPALRMLVGLLQPGTRAGVWIFARYAGELVSPGPVDQAWKDRALQASEEIKSPGMFTNIEAVLRKAAHDWERGAVTHRRHLLLLTDGMVDVSKAPGESAASRERILNELLPKLRDMGVQVHSIALSARADHELLKQLSGQTGGWYEQVDSAEQLQRVFLKLFEKAGKPDGLPLKDNRFLVDNTIREATVLVFRKEGSAEPVLNSPSGQRFTRDKVPAFISWHSDTGYDLITLRDPEPGEWGIDADMDPDNRVMVVTDLKLHVSELPSRIATGESIHVAAHLSNDGRMITRRDFLDLVELRAETVTGKGIAPQPLNDKGYKGDATAMDGEYAMTFTERAEKPEVDLVIAAESSTFLRESRHMLAVVAPGTLSIRGEEGGLQAVVTPETSVLQPDQLKVNIWQEDGNGIRFPLESRMEDGVYQGEIADKEWAVHARIEGMSRLGNPLSYELGPVYVSGMAPAAAPEVQATAEQTESEGAKPAEPAGAETAAAQPEPAAAPAKETEDEGGWLLPALGFAAVNLLVIAGGLAFWWLRRRSQGEEDFALIDDEDDAPPEPDQAVEEK